MLCYVTLSTVLTVVCTRDTGDYSYMYIIVSIALTYINDERVLIQTGLGHRSKENIFLLTISIPAMAFCHSNDTHIPCHLCSSQNNFVPVFLLHLAFFSRNVRHIHY